MLNDYENEFNVSKEVITALPRNNIKNRKKCIADIDELLKKYNSDKEKVLKEIEKRHIKYSDYTLNPEIEKINATLKNYYSKLYLLNENLTSYEKSGLDHIFYQLSHYYNYSLEIVNGNIKSALDIFKLVGIELQASDFVYSLYTMNYMNEIFAQEDNIDNNKLKVLFDSLYWKCPDIIKQITLNFKYLYYKNKKKFDNYYLEQKVQFLNESNMTSDEILEDYIKLKQRHSLLIYNDKHLILNKFINRILDFKDYTKDQIDKNYALILDEKILVNNNINDNIIKLLDSLIEYKTYLKYKYIVDDITALYKEKDKYVKLAVTKKKEIEKLENTSIKLSKKLNKMISKDRNFEKQAVISNKINTMITSLETLYTEYEENLFLEKFVPLDETVSIYDALMLGVSNYSHIIKLMKSKDENIGIEDIDKEIEEVKLFLFNNQLSILKNAYIAEEKDLATIISDKYILFGLNIKRENFTEENLEEFIKTITAIVNNIYFINTNINLDDLRFVFNSLDLVKKKDKDI